MCLLSLLKTKGSFWPTQSVLSYFLSGFPGVCCRCCLLRFVYWCFWINSAKLVFFAVWSLSLASPAQWSAPDWTESSLNAWSRRAPQLQGVAWDSMALGPGCHPSARQSPPLRLSLSAPSSSLVHPRVLHHLGLLHSSLMAWKHFQQSAGKGLFIPGWALDRVHCRWT